MALQSKVEAMQVELASTEKARQTEQQQPQQQKADDEAAAYLQRIEEREQRVAEAEERLKSRKRRDEKRATDLENAIVEIAKLRKERATLEAQICEYGRKEQAIHDAEIRVQEESSFVDRKLDHLKNMVDLTELEREVCRTPEPEPMGSSPVRNHYNSPLTAASPMDNDDAFAKLHFDEPVSQSLQSRMDAALTRAVSGPPREVHHKGVPRLGLHDDHDDAASPPAASVEGRQAARERPLQSSSPLPPPSMSTSSAMGKSAALLSQRAAKRASILGRTSAAGSPRGAMVHTGANQTVASAIRAVSPFANSPRSRLSERTSSDSPRVLFSNDGIPVLDEGVDRKVNAELMHYKRKVEADHSKQRQVLHDRRNAADIALEGRFGERKTREEREREMLENESRLQRLQDTYRSGGARPPATKAKP